MLINIQVFEYLASACFISLLVTKKVEHLLVTEVDILSFAWLLFAY